MVDVGTLGAFALASLLLSLVPGPSVLFVVSRGVALGRRAAVLTVVGNEAGLLLQAMLVATGVGSVVQRSVLAYDVLRLAGAVYIVHLGAQAVRNRRSLAAVIDVTATRSPRHIVREGFTVGATNPKTLVFLTAVLPQFVRPDGAPLPLQMAALGALFVSVAFIVDSTWGLLAGTVRTWLSGRPSRLERLGGAGGLLLIGLGAHLAITGRPAQS